MARCNTPKLTGGVSKNHPAIPGWGGWSGRWVKPPRLGDEAEVWSVRFGTVEIS